MHKTYLMTPEELQEQARRALKAMKQELPTLRPLVKAVSRDHTIETVLVSSGPPRTDGKTVMLPVPIEMGLVLKHDKPRCEKRDDDGVLVCEACKHRERLYSTLFHETGHILHKSFAPVASRMIQSDVRDFYRDKDEDRRTKMVARIERVLGSNPEFGHMGVAGLISPYLPMLVNALEDIRVNTDTTKVRPGTRKMFKSSMVQALRDGQPQADGSTSRWEDAPENAQASIAIYLLAAKANNLLRYLAPEVAEKIGSDDELAKLSHKAESTDSAEEIFVLALNILERLRALGFMNEVEDDEQDPGPGEPCEDGEPGEDGEAGSEPSDDEESKDGDDEGDSSSSGGAGKESDESEEQEESDESDDEGSEGSGGSGSSDDEESDDSEDDDDEESGSGSGSPEDDDGETEDSDDGSDDGDDEGVDEDTEEGGAPKKSGGDEDLPDGSSTVGTPEDSEPLGDDKGSAEEVRKALERFSGHDDDKDDDTLDNNASEAEAVEKAMDQAEHFDEESNNVASLTVTRYEECDDFMVRLNSPWRNETSARPVELDQGSLQASVLKARQIFASNRTGNITRSLKRGSRIDAKHLGPRVATGDDRIFAKRTATGRKSYEVVIGLDMSGSTAARGERGGKDTRADLMKDMVGMQAELMSKLNIPFSVYAHSGLNSDETGDLTVNIGEVKNVKEPWGAKQKLALDKVWATAWNLDGHTLEFYRKVAQASRATDRIILYYTDGQMPAENYREELHILKREIKTCRELGINLLGVGAWNDEPKQYGLEMVRFDSLSDTPKVLEALRKKLM